jgi:Tfp pilus assembly protein PilN
MKYQFDLLPHEYKCLPRDNLGIVVGTIAVLICISATATLYLKNSREIETCNLQVKQAQARVDTIYQDMNQYQSPTERIMMLKNTIEFINQNLETPGTSWVDFLFTFEKTVPEKVFVKDINPKDFTGSVKEFTIDGEAASIYDIIFFISRLQESGKFENVFLKQNSIVVGSKESLVHFTMSFTFKR